jgi:hypothetical protein
MGDEVEGTDINQGALVEAAKRHNERMTKDTPYQQEIRRRVQYKWDAILDPDNLAKIPGTKAYREANDDGGLYYKRRSITADEAKDIIGTQAYVDTHKTEAPQAWADRFSTEISNAAAIVDRMRAGVATESDLDKTKRPSTVDIPQVTFEEVRDMLKGINPNKYSRGIEIRDPATMNEINNIVYAMNRKGDSTFDMLKGIVQSNRAAKNS